MLAPHMNASTTHQRTRINVNCTPKSLSAPRKCNVWKIRDRGQKSGETIDQTTAKLHKICSRNERCGSLNEKAQCNYLLSGFSLACADFVIVAHNVKLGKKGVSEILVAGEETEDSTPETPKEVALSIASRARLSNRHCSIWIGFVLCDAKHWRKTNRSAFPGDPSLWSVIKKRHFKKKWAEMPSEVVSLSCN